MGSEMCIRDRSSGTGWRRAFADTKRSSGEKRGQRKKFGALWRRNRKWAWPNDVMGRKVSWGTTTGESKVSVGCRGPEIFDRIEISSGPSNGIREKILLYTHTRQSKILLRSRSTKLLHTRRVRSRAPDSGPPKPMGWRYGRDTRCFVHV